MIQYNKFSSSRLQRASASARLRRHCNLPSDCRRLGFGTSCEPGVLGLDTSWVII